MGNLNGNMSKNSSIASLICISFALLFATATGFSSPLSNKLDVSQWTPTEQSRKARGGPLMNLQLYEEKVKIRGHQLWYQICAPPVSELIGKVVEPKAPLICLHGGPGVPHDYLEPLQQLCIQDGRTVIFYDQFGCGNSDAPTSPDFYSVDLFRQDLCDLLSHLRDAHGLFAFHLFGQSWGGCLAVETVLESGAKGSPVVVDGMELLSVVLSGTPTSVKQVEDTVHDLIVQYNQHEVLKDYNDLKTAEEVFRIKNYCRLEELPACFQKALSKGGQIFRGTEAIPTWDIKPRLESWPIDLPVFILRGEHDFVDEKCYKEYENRMKQVTVESMNECSHLAHLEDTKSFLSKLKGFLCHVESDLPSIHQD